MKRFLPKFIILFTLLIGAVAIYRWYIYPELSGDLSVLGKIPIGSSYSNRIHNKYPVDNNYVLQWNTSMSLDSNAVIVIGDSFSNRESENEKENSWSRYTAEKLGITIVNVINYNCSYWPEHLFISFAESGLIPEGCLVIVESVENGIISRLTRSHPIDYAEQYIYGLGHYQKKQLTIDWISEATMYVRYRLGWKCPVHSYQLIQPCFSHPQFENTLFVYKKDENYLYEDLSVKIHDMKKTIDDMFRIARLHNIDLVYMIAADKYDAYEPFIKGKHRKTDLSDYFPSNDTIVNTKTILQPYIISSTKDVYRVDDTHWSPIGSKIVGEYMTTIIAPYLDKNF